MNIILLVHNLKRPVKIHLSRYTVASFFFVALMLPCAFTAYLGYQWGSQSGQDEGLPAGMQAKAAQQREHVQEVARIAKANLNALASRLGTLQAHIIRLDALGERLV